MQDELFASLVEYKMSRLAVVLVIVVLLQVIGNILAGPTNTTQNEIDTEKCSDFYTYVCGKGESTKLPIKFFNEPLQKVKDAFEHYPLTTEFLTDSEKKYYEWKKQCVTLTVDNKRDFIRRFDFPDSIGGWPAFDKNWSEDKFDLQNAIVQLAINDVPVIFHLRLEFYPRTFGSKILIEPVDTTNLYTDNELREIIEDLLPTVDLDKVMGDIAIVENWFKTAETHDRYEESLHTDYKGLRSALPQINWDKQVAAVFDHPVPDDFPVEVNSYKMLKEVLSQAFQADPRTVANYMLYRFATSLPDLREDRKGYLFESVMLQLFAKAFGSNYDVLYSTDGIKSFLFSLLKKLYKAEMLFNNEKEDQVKKRIMAFIRDTMPDINDTYYDNVYATFKVNPDDCYSNAMDLVKIRVKLENEKVWNYGPLKMIQSSLAKMLVHQLPSASNLSSAYKFRMLSWSPLRDFIRLTDSEELYNRKSLYDCSIPEAEHKMFPKDMEDYLGIPLIVQGYFDWADTFPFLFASETTKFGKDGKAALMELVMRYYCDDRIEESSANKLSLYFANLKEFQDTFNCPKPKC